MDFLHRKKYVDDPGDYDRLLYFDTKNITDVLEDSVYHLQLHSEIHGRNPLLPVPENIIYQN